MRVARGFSLLEVLLATAIFSIAVVGLARAFTMMVGTMADSAVLQASQLSLDSAAMRILATSNRLPPQETWKPVPDQVKAEVVVYQRVDDRFVIMLAPAPDQQPVRVGGWVRVQLKAYAGGNTSPPLVFLCNQIR